MDVRGALQVAGLPRSREAAKPRREMRGSCEWSVVSQVSRGRGSAGVVPEGLGVCCLLIRLRDTMDMRGALQAVGLTRSREGKCRGFVSGQLSVRRAVDGSPRVWFLRVSVCAAS